MQNVKRVSKALYLGSNIAATALSWVILTAFIVVLTLAIIRESEGQPTWESMVPFLIPTIILFLLMMLLSMYSTVISCVLLYKAWEVIQPGHPRTTPGKAVGFLFIPFFNLYWAFQAFWGYAKDYNAYVNQTGATNFRLNEGLFLTCPILMVATNVPYVGSLASLGLLIVAFICISNICDAVNILATPDSLNPAQTSMQ